MSTPANFEELLKGAIGLDATSIGSSAVGYAVQVRQSACKMNDAHAYWELVRASNNELQALIDVVTVGETWFFRDANAFTTLARLVRDEWLPNHPQQLLRLLSLPCSSGEEAYSLAMTLLGSDLPASGYFIDAVDINAGQLARAKRALYAKNSFRGAELSFRDRFFAATRHGQQLHERVRRQVCFHHASLFALDPVLGSRTYDVIFCRNLLIYFDGATRDRALQVLKLRLAPDGMLFVGPSETGLPLHHGFASIKAPLSFAFRKIDATRPEKVPARIPAPRRRQGTVHWISDGPAPPLRPRQKALADRCKSAESSRDEDESFAAAHTLADLGQLTASAMACDEHLRKYGTSVALLHLMGLIEEAMGALDQAEQFYRKALYLDQGHYDTLVHLAWLREKQGDTAGALVLRRRVQKLDRKVSAVI